MSVQNTEQRRRQGVRRAYSAAAAKSDEAHPFPLGREFAESLGYPEALLAELPDVAVDAFTGVSNVSVFARIPEGSAVLDVGCGAGLDALVAARRSGDGGHVTGIDFSENMLSRARRAAREAAQENVIFVQAIAEQLPLRDQSVDVALVNGIFNLNPARTAIFHELSRVMRTGGAVFAAELVVRLGIPKRAREEDDWFA